MHKELMPALVDLADLPLAAFFRADTRCDPFEEDEFQPILSSGRAAHHSYHGRPLLGVHRRQLVRTGLAVAMGGRLDVHDLEWMRGVISDRLLAWSACLARLDLVLRPSRHRQQRASMERINGSG